MVFPAFLDIHESWLLQKYTKVDRQFSKKIILLKFIEHFYMMKRRKAFLQGKPIYNYFPPILSDVHRTLQQFVYQLSSP